jgi:hypothetical protein
MILIQAVQQAATLAIVIANTCTEVFYQKQGKNTQQSANKQRFLSIMLFRSY